MRIVLTIVLGVLLGNASLSAQEPHRFFDRENIVLFSSVAAMRTLDLHSTWRARRLGGREALLPQGLTDNKPAFAAFSYGMVGGNIAISYAFHKRGWHKAERILSMVHVGSVGYSVWGNYRIDGGLRIGISIAH